MTMMEDSSPVHQEGSSAVPREVTIPSAVHQEGSSAVPRDEIFRGETDGPSLMWLPDSALLEVLSYLPAADLIRLSRTNKRLQRLLVDRSLWHTVDLTQYKMKSKRFARLVKQWFASSIHTLKIKGRIHSPRKEFLTSAVMKVINKNCPNLRHIHIQETSFDSLNFDSFPTTLQTLELSDCEVPVSWLKTTGSSSKSLSLEHLILERVPSFCNYHLEVICSKTNLKTLHLSDTRKINDNGFQKVLTYLKDLEHLKLTKCRITDITLHLIGCHMKNLRTLSIIDFSYLTDEGLDCLAKVKTLEKLSLECCCLFSTKSIIALSSNLPALNYLNLDGITFEDNVLDNLRKSLPYCTITNAAPKKKSVQNK